MISTCYISCACNRLPHAVDWGNNNLVCYAANHAVAIYDPIAQTVLSTLHGHTDRVNVVRWIKPNFSKQELECVSASSDGTAIVWRVITGKRDIYLPYTTLRTDEPLTVCDAIYLTSNTLESVICSGSINGNFKLWLHTSNKKIYLIKTLSLNKKLPTAVRLAKLPTSSIDEPVDLLFFIALEDSTIQIYTMLSRTLSENERYFGDLLKVQSLVGHQDWVTCIDYTFINSQSLILATGSQDDTIRLWKIIPCTDDPGKKDHFLKRKKKNFFIQNVAYEIILETLMNGHDGWVYGLHWHPPIELNGSYFQPLKLLSCSLDKTAIVWEFCENMKTWSEKIRVGEVGGSSLGLYGCKFSPTGDTILTHGYHGSFHLWKYNHKFSIWESTLGPTGHYDSVKDLCWDFQGRFLLTTSADHTTRTHAPWPRHNADFWHEISRPQIHGYEISCLAIFKSFMLASGAEEKVVRIFEAPEVFKKYFDGIEVNNEGKSDKIISIPSLNLSNKASLVEKCKKNSYVNSSSFLCDPPFEEKLIRFTLWPESQKLYGHSYEIFSMAAQHNGTLLATSSKSSSLEHASIILWDIKHGCQKQKLLFHKLTVTQLAFSPDDLYLLSVSRDRRWSLHIFENEEYRYYLSSSNKDSFHKRIIWCCAWTNDSELFATGSRDGKVGVWKRSYHCENILPVSKLIINDSSITALAFTTSSSHNKFYYILAIGFENGCIDIRKIERQTDQLSSEWVKIEYLNTSIAHHLSVKRLSFRPKNKKNSNIIQLASCGLDSIVKIYNLSTV